MVFLQKSQIPYLSLWPRAWKPEAMHWALVPPLAALCNLTEATRAQFLHMMNMDLCCIRQAATMNAGDCH